MRYLPRCFYTRPTLIVARELLGMKLCRRFRGSITSGMIVEVEAYLGSNDDASHSARGRTERNKVMFEEGGHCYVYLIYGMHCCVNIVSEHQGTGSAVLIRAVEPLDGLSQMVRRRGVVKSLEATNGPAKICEAFAIDRTLSGVDLTSSKKLWLEPHRSLKNTEIVQTPRIGISKATEFPWRFYIRNNPWVTRTPGPSASRARGKTGTV